MHGLAIMPPCAPSTTDSIPQNSGAFNTSTLAILVHIHKTGQDLEAHHI